jgi:sugar transferase (PEP-CTERM/EpsH1 system associated)
MRDGRRDLLFLSHRIPYPPDKGDKIRSYHWLNALARAYRVHLAAFVDDPADWVYQPELEALCSSVVLLPLRPMRSKVRSLLGFFSGEALSLPYYRDRRLANWLRDVHAKARIERVFVYSSAMAQYVAGAEWAELWRVIDFVDVDSDKWRQYARRKRGPMRWIYAREARRLEVFEADMARLLDVSLFVSPNEAAWFRARFAGAAEQVTHVDNGVDCDYFDPAIAIDSSFDDRRPAVVFTGAMDYWANMDAVSWFCREVWPGVLSQLPEAVFYIVGSRPREAVRNLASGNIVVTGRVPDVRPYLRHAAAVVAPMRIARGIQNKVLEGMAMARPVVVTSKGLEGIDAEDGVEVLVADAAEAFAGHLVDLMKGSGRRGMGAAARNLVLRRYAWKTSEQRLLHLVAGKVSRRDEGA